MKNIVPILCVAVLMVGCKKEKQSDTIIVEKKVEAVKDSKPQEMSAYENAQEVKWVNNATYTISVERHSDKDLTLVDDGLGNKYYDNAVTIRVIRADGSDFFSHTYRKSDFSSYLDEKTLKSGVLLGIVFVRTEGDNLYFSASVGSPDPTSDEYVPLALKLSRMGSISIVREALDEAVTASADDEDGV